MLILIHVVLLVMLILMMLLAMLMMLWLMTGGLYDSRLRQLARKAAEQVSNYFSDKGC